MSSHSMFMTVKCAAKTQEAIVTNLQRVTSAIDIHLAMSPLAKDQ